MMIMTRSISSRVRCWVWPHGNWCCTATQIACFSKCWPLPV